MSYTHYWTSRGCTGGQQLRAMCRAGASTYGLPSPQLAESVA